MTAIVTTGLAAGILTAALAPLASALAKTAHVRARYPDAIEADSALVGQRELAE